MDSIVYSGFIQRLSAAVFLYTVTLKRVGLDVGLADAGKPH